MFVALSWEYSVRDADWLNIQQLEELFQTTIDR